MKNIFAKLNLMCAISTFCTHATSPDVQTKITEQVRLVAQDPAHCEKRAQLVQLLRDAERYDEAVEHLYALAELQPNKLSLHFDIGYLCTMVGRTQEAIKAFKKIAAVAPQASIIYNIGYTYKMEDNHDAALSYYRKALEMDPNYDNAQFAISRVYLQRGNFKEGWKASEKYLKSSGKYAGELREFIQSGSLAGKTILLVPEGHFGDTLQFVRYAKTFKNMGAHIIVAAQKQLLPLLSGCPFIDILLPLNAQLPRYDARVTMMSAAAALNSDEHTIPRDIPYIFPKKELIAYWKEQLAHDKKFKIGICWQADVFNDSSRPPVARRGIPLEKLYALAQFDGVSLYSLQRFDGVDQLKDIPESFKVHIFQEPFDTTHGSFMDTAAVIKNLDLVITVDTAIGHLAGSMGIPVWLMLPYSTDWRWLSNRTDTPWYPTMRIFKQPHPFDWDSVVRSIRKELNKTKTCAKDPSPEAQVFEAI